MEVATVSCNKCGAALQVADSARFVTCRYCGAQLEVKRTESTISTEVLDRIDQRTADMAEDLDAIRRETELERLDREWALRRETLMSRGKNGTTQTPSIAAGLVMIFISGGFGIFWTIASAHMGAPGFFPLFGIIFIVGAIAGGIKMIVSAQSYSQAEQEYLQRRNELLSRSADRPRAHV